MPIPMAQLIHEFLFCFCRPFHHTYTDTHTQTRENSTNPLELSQNEIKIQGIMCFDQHVSFFVVFVFHGFDGNVDLFCRQRNMSFYGKVLWLLPLFQHAAVTVRAAAIITHAHNLSIFKFTPLNLLANIHAGRHIEVKWKVRLHSCDVHKYQNSRQ